MTGQNAAPTPERDVYRCGAAARGLAGVLAASLLVSVLLVTSRLDTGALRTGRALMAVAVTVLAWWVWRRGREIGTSVVASADELIFERGRARIRLAVAAIESIRYDAAFSLSRSWVPAVVLVDREGRDWRLPTFLDGGAALVGRLSRMAGRNDLTTWTKVLGLESKMRRGSWHVIAGYAVALVVVATATAFRFR